MSRPKKPRIKIRRLWDLNPTTRVVPDKRRRPHRKRKHKVRDFVSE